MENKFEFKINIDPTITESFNKLEQSMIKFKEENPAFIESSKIRLNDFKLATNLSVKSNKSERNDKIIDIASCFGRTIHEIEEALNTIKIAGYVNFNPNATK